MPKKFAWKLVVSLILSLAVFPTALKASGPPAELAIPSCESTLSTCLRYRKVADEEILRLRAQVGGLENHSELLETQRDAAFILAEKPSDPIVSPGLAALGGGVVGALVVILIVAVTGAKK